VTTIRNKDEAVTIKFASKAVSGRKSQSTPEFQRNNDLTFAG